MSNYAERTDSPQRNARPGQMTMAMRAARASSAPKVLRIGKLEGGRVIEERPIGKRIDVTVGTSHVNTFIATGEGVPETMRLFELVDGEYVLTVVDGMRGRLALTSGVIDASQAIAHGIARKVGNRHRVQLGDDARGRIVIGDTAFLFQFVDAPIVQVKAQLPLTAKKGFGRGIDWGFSILAAFSFLAHFGFAGAVNSDWFDPSIDDEAETATMVETAKSRPQLVIEEPKAPVDQTSQVAQNDPKKPSTDPKNTANNGGKENGKPGSKDGSVAGKPSSFTDGGTKLSDDLDKIGFKAISVFDGSAPATSIVLKKGDTVASDQMDELAKKKTAITMDDDHLKTSGGSTPIIGSDGKTLMFPVSKTSNPEPKKPVDPKDQPPLPPHNDPIPQPTIGNVPDADGVVARNRWRFTACFNKALGMNPSDGGTVKIKVTIGEGGAVMSAVPVSTTASPWLTGCVANTFPSMKFGDPEGGLGTFTVPVVMQTK